MGKTHEAAADIEVEIAHAQAEVARLQDELAEAKAHLRTLRSSTAKAKSQPRECTCGCGGWTSGGMFLPGHDARYRGMLLRRIDEGGEDGEVALALLREHPGLVHGVGEWRLGSKAREREAREQAKAERAADAERRKTEKEARKAQAAEMAARSKKEMEDASQARLERKQQAAADAAAHKAKREEERTRELAEFQAEQDAKRAAMQS